MSWSINLLGRSTAVAKQVSLYASTVKCIEPEETIKNLTLHAIETAVKAYPPKAIVRVEASGSQAQPFEDSHLGFARNQLTVRIEPVWGFCEEDQPE